MGYFNLSIDNDITYLLNEIGHNIKVNNRNNKAIVNNASIDRSYDDKEILTFAELKRGDYIKYNDLYFVLLDEVNDKKFNSYYKAIMRRCNYDIKFVLDGQLYKYYTVVESDKFAIDSGIISTFSNKIDITIPYTNTTSKISEGMRIIKFNKAWEVENIDYTRKGLITLMCKSVAKDSNIDDIANEIGNRYGTGGTDILKGNITPIKPFDAIEPPAPPRYNITFDVVEGETVVTDPTIELRDSTNTIVVAIDGIYSVESGTYTYSVVKEGYITAEGTINVVDADIIETVNLELEEVETITLAITGVDRLSVYDSPQTFTVNTDEPVKWSISGGTAKIVSQSGNSCVVTYVDSMQFGTNTLKVELVADSSVFAEKLIDIVFM